ncbi:PaaI family thioesterase [Erythrobacter sp. NFXS35]|uniref:PaaI family thioesterase n=1 Tax=Erythrobacter sp. NFXS35 TaxID=2818436 RepID=UPI0032DF8B67
MSEADDTSYGQLSVMNTGEFAGWRYWQGDPFESRSGPFFYRREDDGSYVSAFRAEPRHMNGGGFMHGGCLMTFADFALFAIATDELNGDHAVTLNLAGDFLGAVQSGSMVEARGEVTRGGGKTIFVRGMVTGNGKPALSFTGIIRRLTRR